MVIVQNGTSLQPLIAMLIQMTFLLVVLKAAPCKCFVDSIGISFVFSVFLLVVLTGE